VKKLYLVLSVLWEISLRRRGWERKAMRENVINDYLIDKNVSDQTKDSKNDFVTAAF
jgi:hypothetical protein